MKLTDLKQGQIAKITSLQMEGVNRQRLLTMGILVGKEIHLRNLAPFGDPRIYTVMDYDLTLRNADAEKIQVEPI
ncbi:FeoA family protein [Magnetofaba australis]|uniref:Putative FeoA family protein n=1 Tax=Magnetofaba australis IT-1 TaxID=1434232 RepID=A0A1Y2K9R7_9PROT|nr:FeoA family protein [Magnetofaba australis]OSM07247.1 putative FeoA family protein [Magnetofaba australis IT-1]